ncbi:MAG: hypothetical protein NTW55_02305 [Planctomycetota bacterium]|nr:hypothetical protein [Planctomycetota bacterium]
MTGKLQFIGLALLVCVLLSGGCNEAQKEIPSTPAEKEKTKLIKRVERKFSDPQAHLRLGRLYQADKLWSQAEEHYSIALSFDPTNRAAQAARVKVLFGKGDTAKARLLAEEYIKQASNSAAESLKLALEFQTQGLDDYAILCYQQALNRAPNSAKINRQIGYYYLGKNDKVRAQEYLTRSFQLNPSQPDVATELGQLGVAVQIPEKVERNASKLDKTVDKYNSRKKQ